MTVKNPLTFSLVTWLRIKFCDVAAGQRLCTSTSEVSFSLYPAAVKTGSDLDGYKMSPTNSVSLANSL